MISNHFIELAKFFAAVVPCVWFLRKEMSEIIRRLDVLETRLDAKIDAKISLLEKDVIISVKKVEMDLAFVRERQEDVNKRLFAGLDEIEKTIHSR